ncbi:MAG: 16S rRNA (guanine(966)-N(2))-methyltransferase RsmD [Acidobacteria bacterium]|nr:16S rRNA (guanine(966)-N(2))-methyltransferase RsmD [Acidobacteriota bacterium]
MRIVGGEFGGRRLAPVPKRGVRPTADPVREALFNVLGSRILGCPFLDLAAGTGAVGLEALSRGASPVVLVEKDRHALAALRRNLETLDLRDDSRARVVPLDCARFLSGPADPAPVGVAFLDPPYDDPALARWLLLLAERGWLDGESLVVVEHRTGAVPPLGSLTALWSRRYGDTTLTAASL